MVFGRGTDRSLRSVGMRLVALRRGRCVIPTVAFAAADGRKPAARSNCSVRSTGDLKRLVGQLLSERCFRGSGVRLAEPGELHRGRRRCLLWMWWPAFLTCACCCRVLRVAGCLLGRSHCSFPGRERLLLPSSGYGLVPPQQKRYPVRKTGIIFGSSGAGQIGPCALSACDW